jgi:hypothetical protein
MKDNCSKGESEERLTNATHGKRKKNVLVQRCNIEKEVWIMD